MFKPLLASPADDYIFPLYVSIKIDGIRCCIKPGAGAVSRNMKQIPNNYIRTMLNTDEMLKYCDGELLTFTNGVMDSFNQVQSKVMSEAGQPEFKFMMFDHFQYPNMPYTDRHALIPTGREYTKVVTQIMVSSQNELDYIENKAVNDGWEGLIARSMNGVYKYGRSTAKEGILLKVVRKHRAEGIVTGSYERMHNANELQVSELGYAMRTSHKANIIGRDDLGGLNLRWDGRCNGALLCDGPIDFRCGTGFDDALRDALWQDREALIGRKVTFEFRGIGVNNRPRFPAFIGFRHDSD